MWKKILTVILGALFVLLLVVFVLGPANGTVSPETRLQMEAAQAVGETRDSAVAGLNTARG